MKHSFIHVLILWNAMRLHKTGDEQTVVSTAAKERRCEFPAVAIIIEFVFLQR